MPDRRTADGNLPKTRQHHLTHIDQTIVLRDCSKKRKNKSVKILLDDWECDRYIDYISGRRHPKAPRESIGAYDTLMQPVATFQSAIVRHKPGNAE